MSGASAGGIKVPDWAKKLCEVLEPKSTTGDLVDGISTGKIKPDDSLYYDLGISPTELASLAWAINASVIDSFGRPGTKRYVTTVELQACKQVIDLMNLVFDRLGA
ncbi:hypothetical protein GPY61_30265 [Massilia sp. NEAU-DD11]|uniref:Uncharacterized protein n=1 Tax=Massilia cellulosiltytica TaxID=2683234 RepID=A0A7X3G5T0_9BURK|nr:hypothetical protein [Telluria cellulosilytica]MVW64221.1 hypothetical protein [Telluria cellulosilytica]